MRIPRQVVTNRKPIVTPCVPLATDINAAAPAAGDAVRSGRRTQQCAPPYIGHWYSRSRQIDQSVCHARFAVATPIASSPGESTTSGSAAGL